MRYRKYKILLKCKDTTIHWGGELSLWKVFRKKSATLRASLSCAVSSLDRSVALPALMASSYCTLQRARSHSAERDAGKPTFPFFFSPHFYFPTNHSQMLSEFLHESSRLQNAQHFPRGLGGTGDARFLKERGRKRLKREKCID